AMLKSILIAVLAFFLVISNAYANNNLTKFEKDYIYENVFFIKQINEKNGITLTKREAKKLKRVFIENLTLEREMLYYSGEIDTLDSSDELSAELVNKTFNEYIDSLDSSSNPVLANVIADLK
ncbi:MAG TPA: hypothetical protein DCL21_05325, partial [Alphaproteobacteria bacterium]|nr:hypothetical protein [Alphaproteobacteria bacterium]